MIYILWLVIDFATLNVGPNSRQLLKAECRKWTNRVYGFPCIFGSPRKTRQLFAKVGVPRGTPPYLTKPEELQKRLLSYCREGTTLNGRQTNFYLGVPNLCFLKLAIMHCRIGFAHFCRSRTRDTNQHAQKAHVFVVMSQSNNVSCYFLNAV